MCAHNDNVPYLLDDEGEVFVVVCRSRVVVGAVGGQTHSDTIRRKDSGDGLDDLPTYSAMQDSVTAVHRR
jgi:hypothetical protein